MADGHHIPARLAESEGAAFPSPSLSAVEGQRSDSGDADDARAFVCIPPGAAQAAKPCSACGKLIPAVSIALHRTKCALRTERRKQKKKKKKKKNDEITTAGLALRNAAAGPDSLSEVEGGTQHGAQLNGCSQGDAGVAGQWTKDAIKDRYSS